MDLGWLHRLGDNRTVLALSAARLADALGNSMMIIIIPLYVAELPSPLVDLPTPALVGILIAIFGIIAAVLQPFMGSAADHLGRHKLFVQIGLLMMAAGILSFTLADQFSHLLSIRVLQGTGMAMTLPTSMALMTMATAHDTRGGSMGIYSTFRMIGFAVGPLMAGYIHVHLGFNAAFYIATALVVLGVVMVQTWVQEGRSNANVSSTQREPFQLFDLSNVTAPILGLTLATFVMASAFALISPLENEFNARLNQTAIGFGLAFSALMISRLVFQIPLGRWSDKIGRKPLVVVGLLVMVPATIFQGAVTTTTQLVVLRLLQGLASAGISAPAFALAADLATQGGEGQQMSLLTSGFTLGIAAGPLLGGFLASVTFMVPFVIGGIMCLVGAAIVYWYVPETAGSEREIAAVD